MTEQSPAPREKCVMAWIETETPLISTVKNADDKISVRDWESLQASGYVYVGTEQALLAAIDAADGTRYAVPVDLARTVLGWDVEE